MALILRFVGLLFMVGEFFLPIITPLLAGVGKAALKPVIRSLGQLGKLLKIPFKEVMLLRKITPAILGGLLQVVLQDINKVKSLKLGRNICRAVQVTSLEFLDYKQKIVNPYRV